jgi:hypothetical protein
VQIGRNLPWVATQGVSTHWIRHTILTWVEQNFDYAVARAYAGHTDSGSETGATATYVRASLPEVAAALAALTGEPPPARYDGRAVTGVAPVTADAPSAMDPGPAWSGPGADRRTGHRGPVPGGGPAGPDCAGLAVAGPGRPGRGRGVVRVGRHRAEDRVRPGLPAAWHQQPRDPMFGILPWT